eukprot:scpid74207/ scgid30990/ 
MKRRECRHTTGSRRKWKWSVSMFKSWTVLLCLPVYTATVESGNRLQESFKDVPVRPKITDGWGARFRVHNAKPVNQRLDVARLPPIVVSLSRQLKEKWATRGQMPALNELGLNKCSHIKTLHIVTPSSLPQQDHGHQFPLTFQARHLEGTTTIKNVLLRVQAVFNLSSSLCSDRGKNLSSQSLSITANATVVLYMSRDTEFSPFGGIRRLIDCGSISQGTFGAVHEVFTFNVTDLLPKLTNVTANDDLKLMFKAHLDCKTCQHLKQTDWNVTGGNDSSLVYVRGHPVTGSLFCSGVPPSKVQRRPSTFPHCPGQECYRKPWRVSIGSMTAFVSPLILLEASASNIDLGVCNGSCKFDSISGKCGDVARRAAISDRHSLSKAECILQPMCVPSLDALEGRWIVYAIEDDVDNASMDSSPTPYMDSGMIYFDTLVIPNSG